MQEECKKAERKQNTEQKKYATRMQAKCKQNASRTQAERKHNANINWHIFLLGHRFSNACAPPLEAGHGMMPLEGL